MRRARRKKKRRQQKQRRRKAAPPPEARWCSPAGGTAGEASGVILSAQIRERIDNVQLFAAVGAEIPDPSQIPGLAGELDGLAEYDRLLILGLDAWDREGEPTDPELLARQRDLFRIGAHIRGSIRALLPWELRARVQAAAVEAAVEEADVWADVEGFRRSGRSLTLLHARGFGPNDTQPLPSCGTLEPWLRWLPDPWLRTIATRHGRSGGPSEECLGFVLRTLRDERAVAACLRERIDDADRRLLVRFTAAGEMLRATLSAEEEADLAPDWDGQGPIPSGSGIRLRTLGLLHVGTRIGFIGVVTQPDELRVRLSRLLLAHHQDALSVLGPRRREYLETAAARADPGFIPGGLN